MRSPYEGSYFTFRFADERTIPRFHLEGIPAGRPVSVFRIDPGTGKRLGLLATATTGEGGWVDLAGIRSRAGSNKRTARSRIPNNSRGLGFPVE